MELAISFTLSLVIFTALFGIIDNRSPNRREWIVGLTVAVALHTALYFFV